MCSQVFHLEAKVLLSNYELFTLGPLSIDIEAVIKIGLGKRSKTVARGFLEKN